MTINPILTQIETNAQVWGEAREEEVKRWLRDGEHDNKAQPTRWQRAWAPGAVALGGTVALIIGFLS